MLKSVMTFMAMMPIGLLCATAVTPEQIAGAKRVNPESGCIELAWSGPKKLFVDETVVAVKNARISLSAAAQRLSEFKSIRSNLSFTCAIKSVSGAAASKVKLMVKDDTGKTIGEKTISVKPGEWALAAFPAIGDSTAKPVMTYKIEASAQPATELEAISLYRSFSQCFELDTTAPMTGVIFHKFGTEDRVSDNITPGSSYDNNSKSWNSLPAGIHDGVEVGLMDKNFMPLAGINKKNGKGLALPVPTRNGCFVSYMIYQAPTLSFQPEANGYKNSNTGKNNQWNMGSSELPVNELDSNGDGIWSGNPGQAWASANTLVQNFGNGKIAYIAFINQNRIDIPAGAKNFRFEYQGKRNPSAMFQTVIPAKAKSVGIVKRNDGGTQLVWNIDGVWTGGSVIRDSADNDCLMVKKNSIIIE